MGGSEGGDRGKEMARLYYNFKNKRNILKRKNPAAGLIDYYNGDKLILVNKTPTARDGAADLVVQGSIGEIFGAL